MSDRGGKNAQQTGERRSEGEEAGDASGGMLRVILRIILRIIGYGLNEIMRRKSEADLAQWPIGQELHRKVPNGFSLVGATAGRAFYVSPDDLYIWSSTGILYATIGEGGRPMFPPDESGKRPVTVVAVVGVPSPTTRVDRKYMSPVVFCNGWFASLTKTGFACAACGKLDACKVCGGCAEYPDTPTHAAYCSKRCQKEHWRVHKHVCAGSSIRRT